MNLTKHIYLKNIVYLVLSFIKIVSYYSYSPNTNKRLVPKLVNKGGRKKRDRIARRS